MLEVVPRKEEFRKVCFFLKLFDFDNNFCRSDVVNTTSNIEQLEKSIENLDNELQEANQTIKEVKRELKCFDYEIKIIDLEEQKERNAILIEAKEAERQAKLKDLADIQKAHKHLSCKHWA